MKRSIFAAMAIAFMAIMVLCMACRYSDTYNDEYITAINYYGYQEREDADPDT